MTQTNRLVDVVLDDTGLPAPTSQEEQERRVAAFDLAEANSFALPGGAPAGPYNLRLSVEGNRLKFDVKDQSGVQGASFEVSIVQFRRVARDYFQICDAYQDAVKRLPPAEIERFDQARRVIHEGGASTLQEALAPYATIDISTARRLFTLVCVLFPKGT